MKMNFTTFSIGIVFLLTLFTISNGQATRCVSCEGKSACSGRNLPRVNCTQATADRSRAYLDVNYQGLNLSLTSPGFHCFRDELSVAMGEYQYRGCIYNNVQVCQLRLRDYHMSNRYTRHCNQCDRDLCNPAVRADISSMGVAAAVIFAVLGKYFV